jgi:hypothetical protein
VETTTLVGVAPDYLVSGHAEALVVGNHFPCAIRSTLKARIGATSGKTKITLRRPANLFRTWPIGSWKSCKKPVTEKATFQGQWASP